jgi:glycosyltransferase involved in cell wall biosynthesis
MEFVPNDHVNKYFSAADAIVLPYKSATQSGVVPVAYHFNKPVIITDVGGLKEIVLDGKTGLVVKPDADHIANGVMKFYNICSETDFDSEIEEFKQQFSWSVFIEKLEMLVLS